MQDELPSYEPGTGNRSDEEDSSSEESAASSLYVSRETTVDEYEDSDSELENNASEVPADAMLMFKPVRNYNVFMDGLKDGDVFIGLKDKQTLYISGVFDLQVVKGGIVYNNVHYNASKQQIKVWHPLCNSIPAFQSSVYAGWTENLHSAKHSWMGEFTCVLKISSGAAKGIMDCQKLYPELKYLWKIKSSDKQIANDCSSFSILSEIDTSFQPLKISMKWRDSIEKLQMFHKNCQHDMRVMVIGAKNSGKSTFLRLLVEKFLSNSSRKHIASEDSLLYLDLDPGQPELSHPDCMSLAQINQFSKSSLGNNFGQSNLQFLKQCYLGLTSPQDDPKLYLELIDSLIQSFEDQNFVGTSLLNLPGWVKGFGINIINHVIARYKPTNIIIMEINERYNFSEELVIPETFSSSLQDQYAPSIMKLTPYHPQHLHINPSRLSNFDVFNQQKFQASQLRTLKTLLLFHSTDKSEQELNYDFRPLLLQAPMQVSIGVKEGISAIQFLSEFQNMDKADIRGALEGTIVALHRYDILAEDDSFGDNIKKSGIYPLVGKGNVQKLKYVTLVLIHSIDEANKVMNVYLPLCDEKKIQNCHGSNTRWILMRSKTETPLHELYPPRALLEKYGDLKKQNFPYISTERRKKQEHVWKVRKNVQRRGHLMK
ncbi:polynucleotide 5'-hydroxyl-kinase KNAG_0E01030 [Huiozyma naganishii CBS 8797]|uniref:Polynucleotide 5'-hydroxyl-kinase GRC3 n=1 Tax=Huiozyma naganishii (strain ATCC MYA-139 / BCRC 22969 / CBS 8797 / KCTC 17520 / NBRC 10181 / NCYC 3082 / Yp74L-3) TaxID=1071383 RepID=J7S7J3_HUIN7|nr:hypothetical protein KNAG_0E01030 [Kazachstania naganishii CBS 8797]CCK70371.1 hypothetical protein KNAG_0E01030 [Kazachstania naganishii CBS 8797]